MFHGNFFISQAGAKNLQIFTSQLGAIHSFIQLYLTSVSKNSSKELIKTDKFLLTLCEFKKIFNIKSF